MSKIQEMIDRMCPEGVVFKTIRETVGLNRGNRLTKSQLSEIGMYEVFHGSKDTPLGRYNQYNAPKGSTIVVNTGGIGGVRYMDKDFWCSDGSFWLGQVDYISPKFLYYCLSGYEGYFLSKKRVGGVPTIDRTIVEDFEIPVPPIEIQEEIVKVLDSFSELTAELIAELTARKKQYEFYMNNLLSHGIKEAKYVKIGDVCSIKARIGWQRLNKKEYLTSGEYYLVTGVDICNNRVDFKSCYFVSKDRYEMDENIQLRNGDIILTKDGTIGKVALIENMDKPGVLNSHLFVIRDKSGSIRAKYLMFVLLSNRFQSFAQKNITQGTIPGLNQGTIIKFEFPVPSIEEQDRIVSILDKFEALTTSLSEGLPAEIKARQQQFEYYRDQLLTFKRAN